MRLKVDQKNDALYLRLDESAVVESEEVRPGVILDHSARSASPTAKGDYLKRQDETSKGDTLRKDQAGVRREYAGTMGGIESESDDG